MPPFDHATCPSEIAWNGKTASPVLAPSVRGLVDRPVVQLRENTRRHSGDVGSILIGRAAFDGPQSLGYLVKRETASGFERRTIGQPVDSQLASCPSLLF